MVPAHLLTLLTTVWILHLTLLTGRATAQGPCFDGVKSLNKETKSQYKVDWKCGVGNCDVTKDVYKVKNEGACYDLAFSMYETRCALYRPSDSTCHLKKYTCDDPRLNVKPSKNGAFTAITICFHCHKTPQWWLDTNGLKKFNFNDKDKIVKWNQGDAKCTCTDQRGWICDWDCGKETNPKKLPKRGEDCTGTRCASDNDACVYTADTPNGKPSWMCVKRGALTDKFCRTYSWSKKTWDGDSPLKNTCSWYPGRKQCSGLIGAVPPKNAVVVGSKPDSGPSSGGCCVSKCQNSNKPVCKNKKCATCKHAARECEGGLECKQKWPDKPDGYCKPASKKQWPTIPVNKISPMCGKGGSTSPKTSSSGCCTNKCWKPGKPPVCKRKLCASCKHAAVKCTGNLECKQKYSDKGLGYCLPKRNKAPTIPIGKFAKTKTC